LGTRELNPARPPYQDGSIDQVDRAQRKVEVSISQV